MKMVLNCVYIWSADVFVVKNKVPGRNLIKKQSFETWHWSKLFLSGIVDPNNMAPGANHARPVGLFLAGGVDGR